MNALNANVFQHEFIHADPAPIVIIGNGPVGIRVLEEILHREPNRAIVIYGDEPWGPYNRVKLSLLLAGEIRDDEINTPLKFNPKANVVQQFNCSVVSINRSEKQVIDIYGHRQSYSSLVIATGSSPHIPLIPGIEKKGVFTFRNLSDAQHLQARKVRARRIVVLGGGLLGVEAARAMQRLNTEVIIVEHESRLLCHLLDDEAAEILRAHLSSLGINVYLHDGVEKIGGEQNVKYVRLRSGLKLECDTIILSTGIRPNTKLALKAKLQIGQGIRVNDQMRTVDESIYAVGECAEHRNKIYGVVAPGYEQANVVAQAICGRQASYQGSITSSKLKIIGENIFSIGEAGEEYRAERKHYIFRDSAAGVYRKIIMKNGCLVGVIATGSWNEQSRIQQIIIKQQRIWLWQIYRFLRTGQLWFDEGVKQIANWPATTVICNCTGITRGQVSSALQRGCSSITALKTSTGVSSVCGNCQPLLQAMLNVTTTAQAVPLSRIMLSMSLLALMIFSFFYFYGSLNYSSSAATGPGWDVIWRDGTLKQISGFSMLGIMLAGLLVSLRKRWKKLCWGDYASWRALHVVLGVLTVVALLLHTGFRFGDNLNYYLMAFFVALMIVGSFASAVVSLAHKFNPVWARKIQRLTVWLHILLFWPVPALLGFHIFKSYYF